MAQVNKLDYTIQYQDLDQNYRLRLYTLENYLLNSAGIVADRGGFGMRYLIKQDCTWVLTNLSVEISYLPTVDEVLTIETWVEQNIHMLSVRNYRLYVNGTLVGKVKSVWAIINVNDRTVQSIFEQPAFHDIATGETVSIARAPRFITFSQEERVISGSLAGDCRVIEQSPSQPIGLWKHTVQYSDIDYNGHCNSCKYLEFMLNACEPVELKKGLSATVEGISESSHSLRIDIKYAKEIRRGEQVDIFYKARTEEIDYEIRTAEGEVSCQARIAKVL
ncbi:MAG: hypothetical protein IJ776_02565 [Paludibacteraceae bacterium]|nr:hypothetical protein [Paludibacteraceae bacterium]